ncbi:hypothetical protein ACFL2I_07060 [Candidatus Omnitrophota bacterium]
MVFLKKINLLLKGSFLSEASQKSIKNNLNYAFTFPELKNRLIYHPKKFLFRPSKQFYYYCNENTQKAAEEILSHCKLKSVSVKIVHEYLHIPKELTTSIGFDPGLPGQIYSLTKYQYDIFINKNYDWKVIAATLAHEISHIFIRNNEILFKTRSSENTKFQEQMTDLITIALGLGRLMQEGSSYYFEKDNIAYSGSLGYLKPNIMDYAQTLMELKVEETNRKIINESKRI